jgi:16S rRNA A1518/A1519 N6-dimethyltransferase RsmA/KsgA/DIM1 with predicted DNA glycosylase/AP lyase activity
MLIKAAGIQPTDHAVEAGAGVGTVAEAVPVCESLTVIEYDVNMIPHLRKRVPDARPSRAMPFYLAHCALRCIAKQLTIQVDTCGC